jgi:hypothetical protein
MRTTAWMLVATTTIAAAAATISFAPASRAYLTATVPTAEGSIVDAWVEMDLSEAAPRGSRLILVQSGGLGRRAQRVPMRTTRDGGARDATILYGVATSRLVPDRVYDVVLVADGGVSVFVPAAFTARAPRITSVTSAAARGEAASATVEFASRRTRVRVGGVPARVLSAPTDGEVVFEVPRNLSRGITRTTVDVATAGTRLAAPMTILPEPRVMSALVGGASVSCNRASYSATAGALLVSGERIVRVGGAGESISVSLPVDLASLTFPVAFDETGGGDVVWVDDTTDALHGVFSTGSLGTYRPGPRKGTFTVVLESFDGSRLTGTFSAHLVEWLRDDPSGTPRTLDVADGRFEVDPR